MALENLEKLLGFTEMVDAIETWAHIVLLIAALYFLGKLIFGTEGEPTSKGKETIESVGRWWKKKGEKKGERRAASRQETAVLNEYVEEKKELELIDEAVQSAQDFLKLVQSPKIGHSLTKEFEEVQEAVKKAGNETNKLKRNTWREERKMKALYAALDEAGVGKGDLDKARALENSVLERHKYVIENLASAARALAQVQGESSKPTDPEAIKTLREAFIRKIIPPLQNAQSGQRSAYKDTEALIAKIRAVWK